MRFWDASAVVPLCLTQPETPAVRDLVVADPSLVVWWATRTECLSALLRSDTRSPRRNWTWAQLMARAFEVDVLCCARCGGRLRLIAVILDPRAIRALLRSLGLPAETPDRPPPGVLRG